MKKKKHKQQWVSLRPSQMELPELSKELLAQAGKTIASEDILKIRPVVWKCGPRFRLLTHHTQVATMVAMGMAEEPLDARIYEGDERGAELIARYIPEGTPDTQSQLVAELVDITERSIPEPDRTNKAGRPRTAHGEAVTIVAGALGITPRSVRYALKSRTNALQIESLGMDVPVNVATTLNAVRQWHLSAAQKLTGMYSSSNNEVFEACPSAAIERTLSAMRALADHVRQATPAAICPYCKLVPGLVEECTVCDGKGWASKAMLASCPPKLLEEASPVVMVKGEAVPVEVAKAGELW